MHDDGSAVLEEFLAGRDDETGLFHIKLTSGRQWAFAPCQDVEPGEALLFDLEGCTSRTVPFETVSESPDLFSAFLVSESDFDRLLDLLRTGRIKPVPIH